MRRPMQAAGDVARREIFDRIEGRPTLKITGRQDGPMKTVTYKETHAEKIRLIRTILADAVAAIGSDWID